MKKSLIYTKTGDGGTTSLVGGVRVSKADLRIEAYGTVDELNSHIGLLVSLINEEKDIAVLLRIQNDLFTLGTNLATDTEQTSLSSAGIVSDEDVSWLEQCIDEAEDGLPQFRGFILPGGSQTSAQCHVCRTVCRRAERCMVRLQQTANVDAMVMAYINRLSDYLFVLARKILFLEQKEEILWCKR